MYRLICTHKVFNTTVTIKGFKSIDEAMGYFSTYFDCSFECEVL